MLTPWRVVNIHLGDCLGGYNFFDKEYEHTLDEPRFIDHGKVTAEVFTSDAHILEINSKSGLYPLYMAYGIYRARLKDSTISADTLEEQQAVWDKVVAENIFVVCKTPMAKSITKRTLVGFRKAKVNTRYFEDLINQIKNKPQNFIEKMAKGRSFWKANDDDNMKFNAIVGNPPYQVMDGGAGASAKPVYNLFVDIAKKLKAEYISMIMPARWYAGGKGLDDFRDNMLNDKHIISLYDYSNSKDVFPNVEIAGGICYFLYNSLYNGTCTVVNCQNHERIEFVRNLNSYNIFVRNNKAVGIIEKLESSKRLDEIVFSRNTFSLPSTIRGHKYENINDYKLLSSNGFSFIDEKSITSGNQFIDKYKVVITYAMSGGNKPNANGMYQVISSLMVLNPKEVCTETFLIIDVFEDAKGANCLKTYLSTKFVRFLLLQSLSSIHITKSSFRFVPIQDFTGNSDIEWNKTVSEIDQQLYAKYHLTDEEIAFIEKMIKPML